jgi:hypothetical protein
MHQELTRHIGLFSVLIGLSIYAPDAALAQKPCAQILAACEHAGFVRGGARTGNGLQVDCIRPVMTGTSQRGRASKPLPQIDAQVITACKARNPSFGQPRAPAAPGNEQPSATQPQAAATAPSPLSA